MGAWVAIANELLGPCVQILLGVPQHFSFESQVVWMDFEIGTSHAVFRVHDTDRLSVHLPDADQPEGVKRSDGDGAVLL